MLLVSLGSAYSAPPAFYRACLDAFADLDRDVVVKVGPAVDPDALGPLPPNASVHRWVPQLSVLAHASAFVTHAGMGGCSEGLWHGVPMVAVPQAVDQFANADRLVELGVAHRLEAGATPDELRAAVVALESSPRGRRPLRRAARGAAAGRRRGRRRRRHRGRGHRHPVGNDGHRGPASPSPDSSKVIAARPASSRATGTRNGLQDT